VQDEEGFQHQFSTNGRIQAAAAIRQRDPRRRTVRPFSLQECFVSLRMTAYSLSACRP
jgi:hypothetical protein